MGGPGLYRTRRRGLAVEDWLRLVDQNGEPIRVFAGVDRRIGRPIYQPGEFWAEPAESDISLVDHRFQVVTGDRGQAAVGRRQQRVDVRWDIRAVHRDDVTVFQRWPFPGAWQQLDILLAQRRKTVHLGIEVGGDGGVRNHLNY